MLGAIAFFGTVLVATIVAGYAVSCVLVALSRDAMPASTPTTTSAFRRGLYAAQRRGGRQVLALAAGWILVLVALQFAIRG